MRVFRVCIFLSAAILATITSAPLVAQSEFRCVVTDPSVVQNPTVRSYGVSRLLKDCLAIGIAQGFIPETDRAIPWHFVLCDRLYLICPDDRGLRCGQVFLGFIQLIDEPLDADLDFARAEIRSTMKGLARLVNRLDNKIERSLIEDHIEGYRHALKRLEIDDMPGWQMMGRRSSVTQAYRPSPAWPIETRGDAQVAAAVFNVSRNWTGDQGVCLVFGESVFYVGPIADCQALADFAQVERNRR